MKARIVLKGGPGSGHRGHAGREGKRGGSLPSGGKDSTIPLKATDVKSAGDELGRKLYTKDLSGFIPMDKNPQFKNATLVDNYKTMIKNGELEKVSKDEFMDESLLSEYEFVVLEKNGKFFGNADRNDAEDLSPNKLQRLQQEGFTVHTYDVVTDTIFTYTGIGKLSSSMFAKAPSRFQAHFNQFPKDHFVEWNGRRVQAVYYRREDGSILAKTDKGGLIDIPGPK